MSEHNHIDCPNYTQLQILSDKFHKLDKDSAVEASKQSLQYDTIIKLLTENKADNSSIASRVSALETKLTVTAYKSDKADSLIDKLSWTLVTKLIAILTAAGGVIYAFKTP